MLKIVSLLLLLLCVSDAVEASRLHNGYKYFFLPELKQILNANPVCIKEYELYRTESTPLYGKQCVKVFSCIMKDASEYTKANMASATVLLGLIPLILSALGSTASEMALLAARRPVFALLLMLCAPALNPLGDRGFYDPLEDHMTHSDSQKLFHHLSPARNFCYVAVQYLLVFANMANVGSMAWDLALRGVPVMSCDSDMVVGLWIRLAAVTYSLLVSTFHSRLRLHNRVSLRRKLLLKSFWKECVKREFRAAANQTPLEATWIPETWRFFIVSWITTIYTVVHLSFGILALSSLSFIGIEDATLIAARFGASAIITRQIVAFEIAGLRSARHQAQTEDNNVNMREMTLSATENSLGRDVEALTALRPVRSTVSTHTLEAVVEAGARDAQA